MQLSAYLLLSENPSLLIELFTSKYGRELLERTLDELIVLKAYCRCNEKGKLFQITPSFEEISDIAYSYCYFKNSGICERCNSLSQSHDIGNYDVNSAYSMLLKKVCMVAQGMTDTLGLAEESIDDRAFEEFALNWIRNSETLCSESVKVAIGYGKDNNLAFVDSNYKPELKNLKPRTVKMLKKIIELATPKIDSLISNLSEVLGRPAKNKLIFNVNYNNLNRTEKDSASVSKNSQFLKRKFDSVFSSALGKNNNSSQVKKIQEDCKVVFNAIHNNTDDNEKFNYSDEYIMNLLKGYNETIQMSAVKSFLGDIKFNEKSPVFVNTPNSIKSIIRLFSLTSVFNSNIVSSILDIKPILTDKELSEISQELYEVFGIYFMPLDFKHDVVEELKDNFIISEEEYRINKPSDMLIKFAHIMSYSIYSRNTLNMNV